MPKEKIKLHVWIPSDTERAEWGTSVYLYNDGEHIESESMTSAKELVSEMRWYEKHGFDLTEAKKELRKVSIKEPIYTKKQQKIIDEYVRT